MTWRCHECGEMFKFYAPAERHMDREHDGGRIEIVIVMEEES